MPLTIITIMCWRVPKRSHDFYNQNDLVKESKNVRLKEATLHRDDWIWTWTRACAPVIRRYSQAICPETHRTFRTVIDSTSQSEKNSKNRYFCCMSALWMQRKRQFWNLTKIKSRDWLIVTKMRVLLWLGLKYWRLKYLDSNSGNLWWLWPGLEFEHWGLECNTEKTIPDLTPFNAHALAKMPS